MLRPVLPLALLALGVTGTLLHAATPSSHDPLATIEDIEWTYRGDPEPHLHLARDGMHSTFNASELPEIVNGLEARSSGEDVAFSLAREAGALACTGRSERDREASGTCRFDPSERYVAELAARGLRPSDNDQVLVLAIVDAPIALLDGLSRAGFRLTETKDLIAAAALDVTPQHAEELKEAGLAIERVEDLLAARALDLDAEWLRGMAEAGYPDLTVERAIGMRALDITPEYARRMNQVAGALGEIE